MERTPVPPGETHQALAAVYGQLPNKWHSHIGDESFILIHHIETIVDLQQPSPPIEILARRISRICPFCLASEAKLKRKPTIKCGNQKGGWKNEVGLTRPRHDPQKTVVGSAVKLTLQQNRRRRNATINRWQPKED